MENPKLERINLIDLKFATEDRKKFHNTNRPLNQTMNRIGLLRSETHGRSQTPNDHKPHGSTGSSGREMIAVKNERVNKEDQN